MLTKAATVIAVIVVCLLLFAGTPADFFAYQRGHLLAGEYWRLLSGHFVHVTGAHLLLNLAAWVLIWVYGRSVCSHLMWAVLLFFCALGTGVGLLVFLPEIEWYTGLSGVLHGLFLAVAVLRLSAQRDDYAAWFILAVVAVKLAYEHFQGPTPTVEWIGVRVIFEAHLYGAISGLLTVAALGLIYIRRIGTGIARA